MTDTKYKMYSYRWVVLAVFMFINLTIQMLWITYAPITGPAAKFYGVTDLQIGLLSMVFMLAFIPLSIPVAWVIDTFGFRLAFHLLRTWNDQYARACCNFAIFQHRRGKAQIGNATIGATADKYHIDWMTEQRFARFQIHVR